jgi:stringent starvation protein B
VNDKCREYGVPVAVVMGIFANETIGGFKFDQTSSAKAFGI